MTIHGFGFDSTAVHDVVTFSSGATGTVSSATATTLTVIGLSGLTGGALTASVTVDGIGSGAAVEVAGVTPVVTKRTVSLAANATTLVIQGFGFSTTAADDTVTLNHARRGPSRAPRPPR